MNLMHIPRSVLPQSCLFASVSFSEKLLIDLLSLGGKKKKKLSKIGSEKETETRMIRVIKMPLRQAVYYIPGVNPP